MFEIALPRVSPTCHEKQKTLSSAPLPIQAGYIAPSRRCIVVRCSISENRGHGRILLIILAVYTCARRWGCFFPGKSPILANCGIQDNVHHITSLATSANCQLRSSCLDFNGCRICHNFSSLWSSRTASQVAFV